MSYLNMPVPGSGRTSPVAPPPTTFENLPNEIILAIHEIDLHNSMVWPGGDSALVFCRLNARMNSLFKAPLAANALMQEISRARSPVEISAALHALDDCPVQYQAACWGALWNAFERGHEERSCQDNESMLRQLMHFVPPGARLRPPAWQRVLGFLMKQPDRAPAPAPALMARLLRECAAAPATNPRVWSDLVGLVGLSALIYRAPAGLFRIPTLGAQRQGDIDIMLACARLRVAAPDSRQVIDMVRRVETEASPACRGPMLQLLSDVAMIAVQAFGDNDPEVAQALQVLLDAWSRRSPAERAAALRAGIGIVPELERPPLLLQQSQALPPAAGLALLARYALHFCPNRNDFTAFMARFRAVIDAAEPGGPVHLAALDAVAVATAQIAPDTFESRTLARLAVCQASRLAPRDAIALLARLNPADNAGWPKAWADAMARLDADPQAPSTAQVRAFIRTVVPRLSAPGIPLEVLDRVHDWLEKMSTEGLEPALRDLIHSWRPGIGSRAPDALLRILAHCERLPVDLRHAPLAALDQITPFGNAAFLAGVQRLQAATELEARKGKGQGQAH